MDDNGMEFVQETQNLFLQYMIKQVNENKDKTIHIFFEHNAWKYNYMLPDNPEEFIKHTETSKHTQYRDMLGLIKLYQHFNSDRIKLVPVPNIRD